MPEKKRGHVNCPVLFIDIYMSRMRIDHVEIHEADIFEVLLDSFPDMVHSVDDDGNIIYTNKTAEALLGYTCEELLKINIRQLYADSVLKDVDTGFSSLKKDGGWSGESLLKAKDGTIIPVEIRSFSIYDDDGNFVRTFTIVRDIRQLKKLQEELVHSGRLAAIGELASGVAHDINNPLTVIVLSNEIVLRELERMKVPDCKELQHVKLQSANVQKASKSIEKLASHLRNFSRGMVESRETVDLACTIEDALFLTNSKIQKNGVEVVCNIEKGKYFVECSPNQIEQVFVNMASNASDAMAGLPERKLKVSVATDKLEDLDCWRCDFTDTGSGIPAEIIEDIFQSFFTTKEKGKGTGLGLSISRGIVSEHKGEIKVTSEMGKGTTFSIYLPCAVNQSA